MQFASSTALSSTTPMAFAHPQRALILDDSEMDRMRLRRMCQAAELSLEIDEVSTIREFEAALDERDYALVFLDYLLVQGDGLIALEMLRRHPAQGSAAAIMIAGLGQIQVAIDALKRGCSDYIIKENLSPDVLTRAVGAALKVIDPVETARVLDERDTQVRSAIAKFESEAVGEIRTCLSGIMRRTRSLKGMVHGGQPLEPGVVDGLEASCTRLWDYLGKMQHMFAESVDGARRPN